MRSLYWKIFVSFWLATILIIFTTAWITGQIAQQSSIPARERLFMDSYANAAVATFESGHQKALKNWLKNIGISRHMSIFLLTSEGEIIGSEAPPQSLRQIAKDLRLDQLDEGIFKSGKLIVSHEILSTSGKAYRLAAISAKPLSHFVEIPWAGLTIRLTVAVFFSGLICYLLSLYLTQPLRSLRFAAKSIGKGKLDTRVGQLRGHSRDEIAELSQEFDRMAEELESFLKSKERLLQDISHELRSPLARLSIAIELSKKKTGDLATEEYKRMELEVNRLNDLIGEILDYTRLDKTMDLPLKIDIELTVLINELIDDANYECKSERIKAIDLQPCILKADPKLLSRAIENILRNALKYSPKDKSIFVTMHHDTTTHQVLIEIIDQGPGVPESELEKIFGAFYRVDRSREKKTGGYGLGLAIAAKSIRLHKGKIFASNQPQGGLKVSILIPD